MNNQTNEIYPLNNLQEALRVIETLYKSTNDKEKLIAKHRLEELIKLLLPQ